MQPAPLWASSVRDARGSCGGGGACGAARCGGGWDGWLLRRHRCPLVRCRILMRVNIYNLLAEPFPIISFRMHLHVHSVAVAHSILCSALLALCAVCASAVRSAATGCDPLETNLHLHHYNDASQSTAGSAAVCASRARSRCPSSSSIWSAADAALPGRSTVCSSHSPADGGDMDDRNRSP